MSALLPGKLSSLLFTLSRHWLLNRLCVLVAGVQPLYVNINLASYPFSTAACQRTFDLYIDGITGSVLGGGIRLYTLSSAGMVFGYLATMTCLRRNK